MTSSVDPTAELAAIKARLDALTDGACYQGVEQGAVLAVDGFGNKAAYRDLEAGSVVPRSGGRMLGAAEQSQPYSWAFQIHHVATTRAEAIALSVASDVSLIGWSPSTNAGLIQPFFFNVYDDTARNGERVQWIASRFYETELGQNPDL